jgi:uncharacterized protein (TIGR04255 family)
MKTDVILPMGREPLSHKPLVEAVFELRWALKEIQQGVRVDPNYKIMVGRLYDRIKDKYPFPEPLPTATMPDEIAAYIVQHRFRDSDGGWPLVQIGPGILTLNDTEKYDWGDFEKRIPYVLNAFFEVYPPKDLVVNGLLLRYIDAIDFDYSKENIFRYLKRALKTTVDVPQSLFDGTGINKGPLAFDLRFSFPSSTPQGAMHLRFSRGKKANIDALGWETMVQSIDEHAPKTCNDIMDWVRDAHELTDDWFFKLIEGELFERFK